MPRVSKRRHDNKRSSKVKTKVSKSKKGKRREPKQKMVVDTFQAWINAQAKHPRREKVKLAPAENMPVDSMEEWLRKQPVVEKETHEEAKLPLGSTEVWLQSQVNAKLLKDEEAKASEAPISEVQASVKNTTLVVSSTTTTEVKDQPVK